VAIPTLLDPFTNAENSHKVSKGGPIVGKSDGIRYGWPSIRHFGLNSVGGAVARIVTVWTYMVWLAMMLLPSGRAHGQTELRLSHVSRTASRPVTVKDSIEMTHLADEQYDWGIDKFDGHVAYFSPDSKKFVIVLRRGDLEAGANIFSMLLFRTQDVFKSMKPDLLVKMSSTSSRFGIKDMKWLADNETIVFLGENPDEASQVYTLDVRTRLLTRRTNHSTAVVKYDITPDGHMILFAAAPPREHRDPPKQAIVVDGQIIADVVAGDCAPPRWDAGQLFLQRSGQPEMRVPIEDAIPLEGAGLSVSPDGLHAVVSAYIRGGDIPPIWNDYRDKYFQVLLRQTQIHGQATGLGRYLLLDTTKKTSSILVDAPISGFGPLAWATEGDAVYLKYMHLPLDVADPTELQARRENTYDVRVTLPDRQIQVISPSQYPTTPEIHPDINVTLEEDLNTPPAIFISPQESQGKKSLLLDLNPQFSELDLGHVEIVSWKGSDGTESQGGLYMPPNYVAGKRYPLVIQTHGFVPEMRFSMDGLNDWASAFAARPLAASGFVVLQTPMYAYNTPQEGPREMARYEGAIDYLDKRGLIDRNRVGIAGFSRTVFHVAYSLTHSEYRFGAATLVDGFDGGYLQYLVSRTGDFQYIYEEPYPFGKGLAIWTKNSPGFSLDRVSAPIRLLALRPRGVLDELEWYAGLALQKKPVEFTFLPDPGDGNNHILVKPWERRIAQQGLVDWFRFWLKNEEDSDPSKADQYNRWRALRTEFRASIVGAEEDGRR
jgi:hypothetical protein